MSESVTIEFTLVEDDLVALTKAHLRRTWRAWAFQQFLVLYWLLPLVAMLLILTLVMRSTMTFSRGLAVVAVIYLIYCVIQSFRSNPRRVVRIMLAVGQNRLMLASQSLSIDGDSLHWRGLGGERRYNWFAINRIQRTREHLFIYSDMYHAFIVPARVFPEPSKFDEFAQLVTSQRERALPYGLTCPKCSYELHADAQPGCPECGWHRDVSTPVSDT